MAHNHFFLRLLTTITIKYISLRAHEFTRKYRITMAQIGPNIVRDNMKNVTPNTSKRQCIGTLNHGVHSIFMFSGEKISVISMCRKRSLVKKVTMWHRKAIANIYTLVMNIFFLLVYDKAVRFTRRKRSQNTIHFNMYYRFIYMNCK